MFLEPTENHLQVAIMTLLIYAIYLDTSTSDMMILHFYDDFSCVSY